MLIGAAALVLLMPVIAALPDLPFGRWRPMWAPLLQADAPTLLIALPIVLLLGALAVAPVVLAGAVLPRRPLAFWLALAAYLGGGLAGYGGTYRTLAGDGLEFVPLHVFIGLGAAVGGALGALIDPWLRREAARVAVVAVALVAAVAGSLTWSVSDAAGFEARRQARRERLGLPAGPVPVPAPARPRACLGRPSADGAIRVFTQAECTGELAGTWYPNGECLKPEGGSHSWDLRDQNGRCPP